MREIAAFAVAGLILIGVGSLGRNVSTITEAPTVSAGVDTLGLMATARDLPVSHYYDYSMVFN
jgi:hypothetical protein